MKDKQQNKLNMFVFEPGIEPATSRKPKQKPFPLHLDVTVDGRGT